jgi:hypothetical protein
LSWTAYNVFVRHWSGILEEVVRLVNVWLVTWLSADKYAGICHPFFAASRCTPQASRRIVAGVVSVAVLFKFPRSPP